MGKERNCGTMKNDAPTKLTYIFIVIYIVLIFYIIIGRFIFSITSGMESEHTPTEVTTAIVALIAAGVAFTIFWAIKNRDNKEGMKTWMLACLFFIIIFIKEINIRFLYWDPIDVLGFIFILIVTYKIWQLDKSAAYLCFLGIGTLIISQGIDISFDLEILQHNQVTSVLANLEGPLELYSFLFFLHAFIYLKLTKYSPYQPSPSLKKERMENKSD